MKLFSNGMEQYLAIKSTLLREVTMSYMHLLIYLSLIDIYSSKRNECSVEHLFIFNFYLMRKSAKKYHYLLQKQNNIIYLFHKN